MLRRVPIVTLVAAPLLIGFLLGAAPSIPAALAQPAAEQCFQETGRCARGAFLAYWRATGGVAQHGFPISEELEELLAPPPAGDGRVHRVQYFQRARFEWHPDDAVQPVKLSLLGSEQYQARYQTPPLQDPLRLSGVGSLNTAPFTLTGGTYRVTWTVAGRPGRMQPRCFHGAGLRGEDGRYAADLPVVTLADDDPPTSGETYLYGVPAGRFYLALTSGCQWTITLAQARP